MPGARQRSGQGPAKYNQPYSSRPAAQQQPQPTSPYPNQRTYTNPYADIRPVNAPTATYPTGGGGGGWTPEQESLWQQLYASHGAGTQAEQDKIRLDIQNRLGQGEILGFGTANRQLDQQGLGIQTQGRIAKAAGATADLEQLVKILSQQTAWDSEDVARITAFLRGEAPGDLEAIAGDYAGSGSYYSGGRGRAQDKYSQALERQLQDINRDAYRKGWQRQEDVTGAQRDTSELLSELGRENQLSDRVG